MKNFVEYMNSKGKIESPAVKTVADKVDCPEGRKYAPEQKGTGAALPYSNGKSVKNSKEPGLGDKGHANLKYSPCKEGKSGAKAAKLPTCEHYSIFQAVREAIQNEPTFVEYLVREFKRHGLMPVLMGEMIGHKETFNCLAEVMASKSYGPDICKKLARALREDIAPPFSKPVAAPVDGVPPMEDEELPPEEEGLDDEVPPMDDEVPADDLGEFGDEQLGDEEMEDDGEDISIGPDGLPTSAPPPAIGPDGQPVPMQPPMRKPMPHPMHPTAPAMENLLNALNLIRS